MWHEWEAIRGQAGGAAGSHRARELEALRISVCVCVWLPAQHSGSRRRCQRDGEQISLKNLYVWLSAWEHKAETLRKFKYYEAVSASAAC